MTALLNENDSWPLR